MKDFEWKLEKEWLQEVLQEVRKQYNEKHNLKEKFKKDAIETQRELWDDVGSVSIANGLEQVVDFIGFINTMKIQKRSHEFTKKLEEKYERMLLSPYFGRMDFIENGEEKLKSIILESQILLMITMIFSYTIGGHRFPACFMITKLEKPIINVLKEG